MHNLKIENTRLLQGVVLLCDQTVLLQNHCHLS